MFSPNIKEIASESGFYDFYIGEEDRSLEPHLTELELRASAAIQKIIETECLSSLIEAEKSWLCLFVAVQYLRVKKQRETLKSFFEAFAERLKKMGHDSHLIQIPTEEDIKHLTFESFSKHTPQYANLISQMNCLLFKSFEKELTRPL